MLLVDTALRAREEQGNPIRVAMVGAGFMSQGLTNQIAHSTPGMRIVAMSNRKLERALQFCAMRASMTRAWSVLNEQLDD